jgi:hypothetical protein
MSLCEIYRVAQIKPPYIDRKLYAQAMWKSLLLVKVLTLCSVGRWTPAVATGSEQRNHVVVVVTGLGLECCVGERTRVTSDR